LVIRTCLYLAYYSSVLKSVHVVTTVYVLYLVAKENSTSSMRNWLYGWYLQITEIVVFVYFE